MFDPARPREPAADGLDAPRARADLHTGRARAERASDLVEIAIWDRGRDIGTGRPASTRLSSG